MADGRESWDAAGGTVMIRLLLLLAVEEVADGRSLEQWQKSC